LFISQIKNSLKGYPAHKATRAETENNKKEKEMTDPMDIVI